jgi:hypothetical protein
VGFGGKEGIKDTIDMTGINSDSRIRYGDCQSFRLIEARSDSEAPLPTRYELIASIAFMIRLRITCWSWTRAAITCGGHSPISLRSTIW